MEGEKEGEKGPGGGGERKGTSSAIPVAPVRIKRSCELREWQPSEPTGRKGAGVSKTKNECGPQ